jgi:lipid II:glycine glycyltransferase (peptidoglycan interpeptide bridge formation enzyme)
MYQGVYLAPESETFPPHRRSKINLNRLATLLTGLSKRYNHLSFSLHHSLTDLRAIQWFNYSNPEDGQFQLSLRYTGLIDLRALDDFDDWLDSIRKVRRQEYRKAQNLGLTFEYCSSFDEIEGLLDATFARQKITRPEEERQQLRKLVDTAVTAGLADQQIVRDPDGNALSATVFLRANGTSYYLVGANHPDGRRIGSGTFALIESLRHRHAQGDQYADMCGINSPGRGDFKTSFNAEPMPYFDIDWSSG